MEFTVARLLDQYPELRDVMDVAIDTLDDEALVNVVQYIKFQTDMVKQCRKG